jgi:Na+/H+-dicarboxylate symporter
MNDWDAVIMRMVMMLMSVAPIGVFCLMVTLFANMGFSAIADLIKYFMTVVFVLVLHFLLTYGLLIRFMANLNPMIFFRKFSPVMAYAFSMASSNATLPVTLETVEKRIGVKNEVASFTVPLGATINMDGTAIMQGVATVFISQAYNIDISMMGYLMVILTATLASIGTAGVPGVGLITLAMVVTQVGLPVEGIALIIGVDRLLDMLRTAVNVTGDATVSTIVARSEGQFDEEVFNS